MTIFGQSAGSWSVMHHVLSLQAEGLFHGAIAESGTPIGHLNNLCRTAEQDLEEGRKYIQYIANVIFL